MYIDEKITLFLSIFSKFSEEIVPSEENLSQSGSGQRTGDEKSNGKASEEIEPSEEDLISSSDQRIVDEKSNGYWFLKKLNPFSKVSEEIEPSEENSSQSDSGQRTVNEKSNGKVSN